MNKICTKCNVEKNISQFKIDKHSKTGLRSCCKACDIIQRNKNKDALKKCKSFYYQKTRKPKLKEIILMFQKRVEYLEDILRNNQINFD